MNSTKRSGKHKLAVAVAAASIALPLILIGCSPEKKQAEENDRAETMRQLEKLRSVPYAFVTADTVDASKSGVITYDPDKAWAGYNFYGTGKSSDVLLMDMTGRIVHKWRDPRENPGSMVLPVLLPGGDVMVIQRFRGLLRLDWNSNIVWQKNMRAHHDLAFLPDSTFYVLETEVNQYRGLMVRFPSIVRMSASGEVIDRWSTFDNLDEIKQAFDVRSFLDIVLDRIQAEDDSNSTPHQIPEDLLAEDTSGHRVVYDYFHANTITILPENPLGENDPRFRPGNILTCFRNVNQIAILDKDTKDILWVWGEGELEWPHHPTMVESGNILIFDNGVHRRHSRVIEVNPVSGSIEWQYVGDPPQSFFSRTRGSSYRLPNGNTLICDSENGRSFEVTRDGQIVWEWLNPRLRKDHREVLYRMVRLPAEAVDPLLKGS
jgi:hypothetical protein